MRLVRLLFYRVICPANSFQYKFSVKNNRGRNTDDKLRIPCVSGSLCDKNDIVLVSYLKLEFSSLKLEFSF